MDIHKPKPWHGWREFLKEYVIIVIGVLTALGAEGVVERIHDNRVSAEARASVRAEIDLNLTSLRQRDAYQHCVGGRFAEIDRALSAAEEGHPFPTLAYIGRPMVPAVYTQRWEAATAGGRTSLLSIDEQRDFARVYAQLTLTAQRGRELEHAWAGMAALEGLTRPSPDALTRAREALMEARYAFYGIRAGLQQATGFAERVGVRGDAQVANVFNHVPTVCLHSGMTRAAAQAASQDPFGAP